MQVVQFEKTTIQIFVDVGQSIFELITHKICLHLYRSTASIIVEIFWDKKTWG